VAELLPIIDAMIEILYAIDVPRGSDAWVTDCDPDPSMTTSTPGALIGSGREDEAIGYPLLIA
jgi:hypothetical protein